MQVDYVYTCIKRYSILASTYVCDYLATCTNLDRGYTYPCPDPTSVALVS